MVEAKIIKRNFRIATNSGKNEMQIMFRCRSRRILKSASKLKKNTILFYVARNDLKLDLNASLIRMQNKSS